MNSAIFNSFFRKKLGRRMGLLAVLLALLGQGNVLAQTVEHSHLLQQHWENEQERQQIIEEILAQQSWDDPSWIIDWFMPNSSYERHLNSLSTEDLSDILNTIHGIEIGLIPRPTPMYETGTVPDFLIPGGSIKDLVSGVRNGANLIRQIPRGAAAGIRTAASTAVHSVIRLPRNIYAGTFSQYPRVIRNQIAETIKNAYEAGEIGIFSSTEIAKDMELATTFAYIRENKVLATLSFTHNKPSVIGNFPRLFDDINTQNVVEVGRFATTEERAGLMVFRPGYQYMAEQFARNPELRFYIECKPAHAIKYMEQNWQYVTQGPVKVFGQGGAERLEETWVLLMDYDTFLDSPKILRFLK